MLGAGPGETGGVHVGTLRISTGPSNNADEALSAAVLVLRQLAVDHVSDPNPPRLSHVLT
jgi:hypothetical protein